MYESFKGRFSYLAIGRLLPKALKIAVFGMCILTGMSALAADLAVHGHNLAPARIARGPDGKFFVSDPQCGSVFIYDGDLAVIGELKGLDHPLGVAVDPDGRIYVGSDGSDNVEVYDATGVKLLTIGQGRIRMPTDLELDFDGNLYVADSLENRVLVFDHAGQWIRDIGSAGSGNGEFNFPTSIAIAYTNTDAGQIIGELYVADQGNARIQVFDLQGDHLRSFGSKASQGMLEWNLNGRFIQVQSIFLDAKCRVDALDSYACTIQQFDAQSGAFLSVHGTSGPGIGEMNVPLDVVMDDNGRVIVANYANHRVEVIYTAAETTKPVTLSNSTIAENGSPGTLVGVLMALPQPSGGVPFLLVPGPGSVDNGLFTIEGSNLFTKGSFDFESKSNCSIRVAAAGTDVSNLGYATVLSITVSDIKEAPFGLAMAPAAVPENEPPGTVVGGLLAIDPDARNTLTYSLTPGALDNSFFNIVGTSLVTAVTFDYEVESSYQVQIVAVDSSGSCTGVFAVAVLNVNDVKDVDTDNDGMPDWWEMLHSVDSISLMPLDDADKDGVNNLDEWIAGTNPDDPTSFFRMSDSARTTESNYPVLFWSGVFQRVYSIDWTTNLTDRSVTALTNNLPATPTINAYTDTIHGAETPGFYRIGVHIQP